MRSRRRGKRGIRRRRKTKRRTRQIRGMTKRTRRKKVWKKQKTQSVHPCPVPFPLNPVYICAAPDIRRADPMARRESGAAG